MNRYSLVTICWIAAGLACQSRTAAADGFEAAGFRALARHLAVGLGPGYHARPCTEYRAPHYHRSVQGTVHPAHQLTPLHWLNKSNALRQTPVPCQTVPPTAVHTMPTIYRYLPSPATDEATNVQPIPHQTIWQPAANDPASNCEHEVQAPEFHLDEIDDSAYQNRVIDPREEADTSDPTRHDLETKYQLERLPNADTMTSTVGSEKSVRDANEPAVDGSQFEDVELQDNSTESDEVWNPLNGQPVWEENGPAQPRLSSG